MAVCGFGAYVAVTNDRRREDTEKKMVEISKKQDDLDLAHQMKVAEEDGDVSAKDAAGRRLDTAAYRPGFVAIRIPPKNADWAKQAYKEEHKDDGIAPPVPGHPIPLGPAKDAVTSSAADTAVQIPATSTPSISPSSPLTPTPTPLPAAVIIGD